MNHDALTWTDRGFGWHFAKSKATPCVEYHVLPCGCVMWHSCIGCCRSLKEHEQPPTLTVAWRKDWCQGEEDERWAFVRSPEGQRIARIRANTAPADKASAPTWGVES